MRTKIIFGLFIMSLFTACKLDSKQWETNVKAPLFKATLGVNDLLADSLLDPEADGKYNLIYEHIYDIDSVLSYLDVPDTVDKVRITLDKLILADRTYVDTFTLRQMDPTTGLLDGLTVELEAQEIKDPKGEQEIDVSEEFFKTAKFNKGYLDITIFNDLPVYVDLIVFKLRNKVDGTIVAEDTFTDIPPQSSAFKAIDLAGKAVDGVMIGSIGAVKTRASDGPVLVDADKGVRLSLSVRGLEPEYATAIFPAQTLVYDTQEVVYKFGQAKVTEIKARSGWVKMRIASTIEEEIIIDYSFPFSGENGDFSKPFKRQYVVPPAEPGKTQIIEGKFPLDGYVMRYQGKDPLKPPLYNTVYSELTAKTVYSGKVRNLSLDDFVDIEFGLVDVKPEYAFGDFGYKVYDVDESFDVPLFKKLSGNIAFDDIGISLSIENAFGIEAQTTVNKIEGTNTKTGGSVSLTHPDVIGKDILLKRATNPPLTASRRIYHFDKSISNIVDFVELMPDKITTDMQMISRPNGSNDYRDFVKDNSYLRAILALRIPLTVGADKLGLVQKNSFDLNSLANSDKIKSGTFKLKVINGFPIDVKVKLEFLDDDDNVLHSMFASDDAIKAGELNYVTGKTETPSTSYLTATVSELEMDVLRDAKKIRVNAVFDTPHGDLVSLYSSYKLFTQLSADFIYEQTL